MIKQKIPVRTYIGKPKKHYTSYKTNLVKDFDHRCAYCDDYDAINGGYKSYHIDHFAPKDKFPNLHNEYCNLLYTCPYCNIAKSDDWPSDDARINVVEDKGYIDPCCEDYYNHLDRESDGKIVPKTKLGEYMYSHLKLFLKRHEILYNLSVLQDKICKLKNDISSEQDSGKDTTKKEDVLHCLYEEFFKYFQLFNDEQNIT